MRTYTTTPRKTIKTLEEKIRFFLSFCDEHNYKPQVNTDFGWISFGGNRRIAQSEIRIYFGMTKLKTTTLKIHPPIIIDSNYPMSKSNFLKLLKQKQIECKIKDILVAMDLFIIGKL